MTNHPNRSPFQKRSCTDQRIEHGAACHHFQSYAEARAFADLHGFDLVIDQGPIKAVGATDDEWATERFIACDREAFL